MFKPLPALPLQQQFNHINNLYMCDIYMYMYSYVRNAIMH